jgi:class 3 adenylate cyclase/tetratricopeptide (TPR) repeat protein
MRIRGTLAFVDISGFTKLTERLARKGKVGAEEMSDILSATFAGLLTEARADGADLVKWGGDAVLLLFQGPDHALRAARSAYRMRAALRTIGRLSTTSGAVTLRMSMGIHSGDFDFFLVGDPEIHRELLISGPGASITADYEAAASAGQIGLSPTTVALLPPRLVGGPLGDGRLLRSQPLLDDLVVLPHQTSGIDPQEVLPQPIRAHLLAGDAEPEHRTIAVAFVQFSGTDAMLTREGPVAVAEALDDVVRNVQGACAEHEVTFFETDINRDGGKIMLTAGAPRSSGHDEERMLRVARLVLDRMGRLPLRMGINRGAVFSGDFGPAFRRTYSVKGDAINLAARVMGKASPGQALATLEVVQRSHTVFRTVELPPFTVKGKSQPVRAAEIGELVGARDEERMNVPLIGRAVEMATLHAALDDVRARQGRLVEVVGEPGIGKSRLVEELLAGVDDVPVVSAPCEEYESSTAYFPFRRLLRDVLGVPVGADPVEVTRRLVDRVSVNAPHLVPWLPLLGVPLDLRIPPTRETEELNDQFRKARLEDLVSEFLAWVLPTSTVLVVEDAHFMDEASADLLARLAADLGDRPWLLLATRREASAGYVPEPGPRVTTVRPALLDPGTALKLVQVALDDHPLTQQALESLAARGGGNPMFLEALVLEAGRSGTVADLPESVEGLVTSQIDRLDPADRTVLRYAAVLGTVVDEAHLDTLLDDHDATVAAGALRRLSTFLVRERPGRLRFRHTLMRDVAYEGLPFSRRRTLHDQVGQAIERASLTPEAQCELLSLHFFHAGRYDKAWTYSVLASDRARAKFANGETVDFLERAVVSARRVGSVSREDLAHVLEGLGDAQFLIGLSLDAAETYAQARRLVRGDPVRTASIIEKEARVDQRLRRLTQSLRRVSRGLRELEGRSDSPAYVARSLLARRYARSRYDQGRIDEALQWADIAARAAEDAVNKEALAQAYEMLNALHAGSGRDEPMPYGRLALQAYTELGYLPGQAHCLNNLAVRDFATGEWDEALDKYRRATDMFRRMGDTASEGNALYNQAELLVSQRRHDHAAAILPDVLRIARAVKDAELVALALREQAQVVAASGDVTGAISLLDETRSRFESLGEPQEARNTDAILAEVLIGAGRQAEASEVLARTAAGLDPRQLDEAVPNFARLTAAVQAAEGLLAESRATLEAGLAGAEEARNRYEQGLLLRDLAAATRRQGKPHAAELDHRADAILGPMGVLPTVRSC